MTYDRTTPPGTFDQHVERVREAIRQGDPGSARMTLVFYVFGPEFRTLDEADLLDQRAAGRVFLNLCEAGTPWINLAPEGRWDSDRYVVAIEHPNRGSRAGPTDVLFPGPPFAAGAESGQVRVEFPRERPTHVAARQGAPDADCTVRRP